MEQIQLFTNLLRKLEKGLIILPDKSEENADNTLRALWHFASGNQVSPILAEKLNLPTLSTSQIISIEDAVDKRLSGVPLAHITARQHFLGLDYILNKGLYIPRKETELLAKNAIETIQNEFVTKKNVMVMDLCTGIGTVALAIAHYCTNSQVYGSDIYKPAIEAAKINAQHFQLEARSTFFHSNLFDPFENLDLKGNTHLIVSAPPYISSAKVKHMAEEIVNHEPEEAFDAGPFGLSVFNQLISVAPEYLIDNGFLIFECGLGQGDFLVNRLCKNTHYGEITLIKDENGNGRVIKAKKIS
jgi:release factor glutamine methyltransferase